MADVIAGRAELVDPLAHGATGTLWRALDLRFDAVCAAKVMRQRDGSDVLRFVREQSVGASGGHAIGPHPHLLLPYTWIAEDDAVALLMPLVHGGTLDQAMADHGALHPLLVLHLARQMLEGLHAVHAAGWVHRDVKPANLLLETTGTDAPHLRLADFGIALHEQDARLTETGMVPGTPGYLAPEALQGNPATPAQDLWAVGMIALRAVATTADPTVPTDAGDVLARTFDGPEGMTPGARELRAVLEVLLAPHPEDRGTAAAVRDMIPCPAPGTDPDTWVRTADGEPFEVFDQLDPLPEGSRAGSRPEVPADGPGSLRPIARGLHDRLSPLAIPGVSDASAPSADPATSAGPAAAEAEAPPATVPAPARTSGRRWQVLVLIAVAVCALAVAVVLTVLAVRSGPSDPSAGPGARIATISSASSFAREPEACGTWGRHQDHEQHETEAADDSAALYTLHGGTHDMWEEA
jgi:serine/threonine protein kinase